MELISHKTKTEPSQMTSGPFPGLRATRAAHWMTPVFGNTETLYFYSFYDDSVRDYFL